MKQNGAMKPRNFVLAFNFQVPKIKTFNMFTQHQPHKMVKHTQTFCQLLPTNCLGVVNHFAGLGHKGIKVSVMLQLHVKKHDIFQHNDLFKLVQTSCNRSGLASWELS